MWWKMAIIPKRFEFHYFPNISFIHVFQISSTMAVSMSNNMLNTKMMTIEDLVEANEVVYDSFPANILFIFSCN
jgi:ABC-type transport system involved in Fe-S cluster assembly fused permease/ATPase subunit